MTEVYISVATLSLDWGVVIDILDDSKCLVNTGGCVVKLPFRCIVGDVVKGKYVNIDMEKL